MNRLNPVAVGLWITCGAIGYAVNGAQGAAIGIAISAGISTLLSIF